MPTCPQCHADFSVEDLDPRRPACPVCAEPFANVPGEDQTPDTSEGDPLASAPIIEGFEITRPIGRGGMGDVWEARQTALGRKVAIKVLAGHLSHSGHFLARFTREARTLGRLQHPGIVSIYDFRSAHGQLCCIIMEYVEGPDRGEPTTLHDLILSKQLTPDRTRFLVLQVLHALQYAHEEGVIHRDIKPTNILIDRHGRVKVVDFGIAAMPANRSRDPQLTFVGGPLGTAEYMAPEQTEDASSADHRADLYAVGVVLYEMLTGDRPRGAYAPPSQAGRGIDPGWDDIVQKALQPKRENRYASAQEMIAALQAIRATTATSAAAPLPAEYIPHLPMFAAAASSSAWSSAEEQEEFSDAQTSAPTNTTKEAHPSSPEDLPNEADAQANPAEALSDSGATEMLESPIEYTSRAISAEEKRPAAGEELKPGELEIPPSIEEALPAGDFLELARDCTNQPRKTGDQAIIFRPAHRPPLIKLCVLDDGSPGEGEWFRIRQPRFVIGRTEGDLLLSHDPRISARHAEILLQQSPEGACNFLIRDLNTTNGTFARAARAILEDGQEFLLGDRRYKLKRNRRGQRVPGDRLLEITKTGRGKTFHLGRPRVLVGRDPTQCHVLILDDPFLSPVHAVLLRDAQDRWIIKNYHSRNGIWIRIQEMPLVTGGEFQIGSQRFIVQIP